MIGQRLEDGFHHFDSKPGDYWRTKDGRWEIHDPAGHVGDVSGHEVVEHEDGTITVSPSILVTQGPNDPGWHGYLERGVWRQA